MTIPEPSRKALGDMAVGRFTLGKLIKEHHLPGVSFPAIDFVIREARKGMVTSVEVDHLIAEAVKAERERCLEILKAFPNKWLKGDVAAMLYGSGQRTGAINPPKEGA